MSNEREEGRGGGKVAFLLQKRGKIFSMFVITSSGFSASRGEGSERRKERKGNRERTTEKGKRAAVDSIPLR